MPASNIDTAICSVSFVLLCYFGESLNEMTFYILAVSWLLYTFIATTWKSSANVSSKSVLVTGCDTGFGHELAKALGQQGAHVFACCLSAQSSGAKALQSGEHRNVQVLQVDITKDEDVQNALQKVTTWLTSTGNEFHGLVNNAGLNFLGDLELSSMQQYHQVADVNLFGTVRMTKAFLPLLRKFKGRIINITSVKGRQSVPVCAPYSITKFALETFSDILRMEMKKWGVKVVVVEPGNYGGGTGMMNLNKLRADLDHMWDNMSEELKQAYGKDYIEYHMTSAKAAAKMSGTDLSPVVKGVIEALTAANPKARFAIGGYNSSYWIDFERWLMELEPYMPTSWSDAIKMRGYADFPLPQALRTGTS